MKQFTHTITDTAGIHARPAALLVKKAQEFESDLTIEVNGHSASAKGILGIMGLGAKHGDTLTVTATGSDEDKAAAAVKSFLEENL